MFSSSAARSRIIFVSFALRSAICSSFSEPRRFHCEMVAPSDVFVSCIDRSRFWRSCLSFERLLASMSRPAGPSSRIWKRPSKTPSSSSNSSSLSSGGWSMLGCGGTNLALRWASLRLSASTRLVFFNLVTLSVATRSSFMAFLSRTSAFVLSRMASSRCTTARPSLSTRSAVSFTRFFIEASLPRAARPRCSSRTSMMWALRISVIIPTASCASLESSEASRLASSSSRWSVSDCSRPFLNSRSSREACALNASFFAEVMASWSWSARTLRASFEASCRAASRRSLPRPRMACSCENSMEPMEPALV
mmetsp:Transcript_36025/g.95411  ORF Transcript_36025/g.95411 Transcript_36025/m.95411 type:complete len:308 (+) Transcript_36025:226-1149(+)